MRSKAPLALMELMIMLTVFALAAALCISVFLFADDLSAVSAERDGAAAVVQNTAELVKVNKGGEGAAYDENWQQTDEENAAYRVIVSPIETDNELLGSAEVYAENAEGERIFGVTVSWQEGLDG